MLREGPKKLLITLATDAHEMNRRKGVTTVMKTAVLLFVIGVSLTLLFAEGIAIVAGLFVTALLASGLGFTLHEFKRLSAESEAHNRAARRVSPLREYRLAKQLPASLS